MTKIKEKIQHYFKGTNNCNLKEVISSYHVNLHLDYTQNGLINSVRNFFNPKAIKSVLKTKMCCLFLPFLKY